MSKDTPVAHTHIIEANSVEELKQKVADLNAAFNGGAAAATPATETAATPPPKESSKSKTKAKKETPPPEPEESEESDDDEGDPFAEDEGEEEESALTLDQVRSALQEVGTEHGVAKVKEILKKVGAKNYKEVKESDFAKVIKACKAA